MSYGFVYVMINHAMPGIFKIGCTERAPHLRAEELSKGTSVPLDFRVLCYIEVHDCQAEEARLHKFWTHFRLRPDREFFRIGSRADAKEEVIGCFIHHPRALAFTLIEYVSEEWQFEYGQEFPDTWTRQAEEAKKTAERVTTADNVVPLKTGTDGAGGDDEPF